MSRASSVRPVIAGDPRGRLWVDQALLDPSSEYQWIRESTLGERDEGNLQLAMDENGFVPVDAKEIPSAAGSRLPGQKVADGLIRRGGLILMKRPREWADEQADMLRRANAEAIAGVTKDLSAGFDGRNVEAMPGAGVVSSTERYGGEGRPQRFQE